MAVMREETFGPVLPVMRVPDAEAALRVANDSPDGPVGQRLVGRRAARAARWRAGCEAGSVCVNDVLVNYFCVEAPLGGIKAQRHAASGTAPRACASSAASRPSSRTTRCSVGCRRCSAAS